MYKDFKKCALKLCKRATGIGLGVLFALNASLSTAHALSAKDVLATVGCDNPQTIQTVNRLIHEAAGNTRVAFVDLGKLHTPDPDKMEYFDLLAYNNYLRRQAIVQVLNDPDVREDVKATLARSMGFKFSDSVLERDLETDKNVVSKTKGAALLYSNPQSFLEMQTAVIAFDFSAPAQLKEMLDASGAVALGAKAMEYMAIFTIIHEAAHASQTIDYNKWLKTAGIYIPPETKNYKESIRTRDNAEFDVQKKMESGADIAGVRAVLETASDKKEALDFVKCIAGMRAQGMLETDIRLGYNTLEELSHEIRKADPSYPSMPKTNTKQLRMVLEDAWAAQKLAEESPDGQPAIEYAETAGAKALFKIIEHGKSVTKAYQAANKIEAKRDDRALQPSEKPSTLER